MELIFNEISLYDKPENEYKAKSILKNFAQTCGSFKKEGFSKLRVESNFWTNIYFNDINLSDFLQQIPSQTQKSFLRSFIRKPFIADDFLSDADEKYVQNEYFYETRKVTGLAYAYLLNTIAVSLLTNLVWENTNILITEKYNEHSNEVYVKNVSKPEHLKNHRDWINSQKPIVLIKTDQNPEDKVIKLRDDHGKDILRAFSEKLRNSVYVRSIINSLPFNPNAKNFIHKIYPNGQIEIVLNKTDKGLGIIVQTTGRDLRETTEIAKILEDKYK